MTVTPRVMLLMICVLAVLLEAHGSLIHSAANHMHKLHLTSHSNFDGPYGLAAAANLSRWRSSLFAATMDFMASGDHGVRGRYDLLEPIVTCPPGTALERVGAPDPEDDGGKWLCSPLDNLLPHGQPCVVYSFGSNMNFMFESAILNTTGCEVHTYDCTVPGATVDRKRHTFHRKCVGPASMGRDFMTWEEVLRANGHSEVHILKVDIEGSEWATLGRWTVDTPGLPTVIAIELHIKTDPVWQREETTISELALFVQHLGTLGYAMVQREPNPECRSCAEFTFLRVEVPRRFNSMPRY